MIGLVALELLAPGLVAAEEPLSRAAEFIRQAGNQLAVLAGSAKSFANGRAQLGAFVDRVADVDNVARFCLGRYWRLATPAQQQQYVRAFRQVLVNSIAIRLGDYQGGGAAHVIINRPTETSDGIHIATTVERPNNPPAHVTWVVSMETGSPKIVDVIAEGMSMRLTQRSDYSSFLSHHDNNIEALIQALRTQASST
jgi:phospholipid transport system substrate-binding protein